MDIEQIIKRVKNNGSHFFDREAMQFFRSRVCDDVETLPNRRALFITSEQFQFRDRTDARLYTVRFLSADNEISEVGGFQYFDSKRKAVRVMRKFAEWLRAGYVALDDPDCCSDCDSAPCRCDEIANEHSLKRAEYWRARLAQ